MDRLNAFMLKDFAIGRVCISGIQHMDEDVLQDRWRISSSGHSHAGWMDKQMGREREPEESGEVKVPLEVKGYKGVEAQGE